MSDSERCRTLARWGRGRASAWGPTGHHQHRAGRGLLRTGDDYTKAEVARLTHLR